MKLTDPLFWFFIVIAAYILYRRMKAKNNTVVIKNKPILVKGEQLITPYTLETPLACLLDDGKIFGDDFYYKEKPNLPHTQKCQCSFCVYINNTEDLFNNTNGVKTKNKEQREQDIPELNEVQARYYKYSLILRYQEMKGEERKKYERLLENVVISEKDKEKIKQHLLN